MEGGEVVGEDLHVGVAFDGSTTGRWDRASGCSAGENTASLGYALLAHGAA